jgi:hypothetical protein
MRINHKLIKVSEIARIIGKDSHYIKARIGVSNLVNFTDEENRLIREAFDDLFCYIYDVDEVEIVDNKLKGIKL